MQNIIEEMQTRQTKPQLPNLKRLPFIDSVQYLHAHNSHVARVCLESSSAKIEAYDAAKQKYRQQVIKKEEERSRMMEEKETTRKKSLEAKRKQHWQHNRQNLQKLQRFLEQRRQRVAKKGEQHMIDSQCRKQEYQQQRHQQHALTLHHSTHSLTRIKHRQETELGYSLTLFQQNQQKAQAAKQRKKEQLEESRSFMRTKNESGFALEKSRQKEVNKQEEELQRIIKKYSAAHERIAQLASTAEKMTDSKKTELQKTLERHRRQRSRVKEEKELHIQEDVKAELAKLDQADSSRQKAHEEHQHQMQTKRHQKKKTLMNNSFYLQEEAEKRAAAILQRHHETLINLANTKAQKELLRCSNLHDSFKSTLRC